MKKIVILLLTVVSFFSCSNNVEFNNPAMQAKKDGDVWKAETYRANIDNNGRLRITGSFGYDNLTLLVTSTNLATYELGNTISEAVYNDGKGLLFSTNNIPNPDVSVYEPDGKVEIYEYDRDNNYVSGRFNFNAYDITGFKTLNFNQGDFYRVPVTGEPINNTCNDATVQVNSAETVYTNTGITDPNYTASCTSYKNALLVQIEACGDPSGSLLITVNNLGDCTVDTSDPCDLATANANSAEVVYNSTPNSDAQYLTVCNSYKAALQNKIIQCGDPTGSIQTIVDGLGNCTIDTDTPEPCAIATENANDAQTNYDSVPNTDVEYPTVCEAYIMALENKILNCGDPGAIIEDIIEELGDCSILSGPTGGITVNLGTAPLTYGTDITFTQVGTTITVFAKNNINATNTILFEIQQNATGVDIITNFMIQIGTLGTTYIPTTDPTKNFSSNITLNNGTVLTGTFSGTIESTGVAAPDLELNNGIINIMY